LPPPFLREMFSLSLVLLLPISLGITQPALPNCASESEHYKK